MFNGAPSAHGLRSSLLLTAAVFGFAAPATAQDQTVETVVVTGSRIPQTGLYSSSPVTAIGKQELKLTGSATIENVIRMLPSVEADVDSQFGNNASLGENNIDLRGLGTTRTLVLVDGKRLNPADQLAEVDLSQIPPGLVDHIEVYTGGASAVYGSDAIAGVVNVLLRKDFEGFELDASYKQTDHNDGQTTDVSGIMGFSSADGRGNVTMYADYQNRQPIFQGDRIYGAHALNSPFFSGCGTPATHFGGFCFGGSANSQEGLFVSNGVAYFPTANGAGNSDFVSCTTACPLYNFAPVNYFQTPNERYAFGAIGHYELSKMFDVYTRMIFSSNYTPTQLAPTPINSTFQVNYGNPYLSDQERTILFPDCTPATCDPIDTQTTIGYHRRLVENGNRDLNFDRGSFQMVIGTKGDLGGGWSYDVSGQYGRSNTTARYTGDAKFTNFKQGLIATTDSAGNPVCVNTSNNCVPIDIFAQNDISPAAVQFFTLSMDAITRVQQWDLQGSLTGDLGGLGLQSPWAKNPVAVSLGGEYRQEQANFEPDDNLGGGNLLGFTSSPPVHGRYNVSEGFGEIRVPVIEGMRFAELLQFEGAYRYSSYSTAGAVSTYKYSGEWAPTDDFRFRASFEKAVRAPNINELFAPQGISANPGKDPCSDLNGTLGYATTTALCEATGVPANALFSHGLQCPSSQCTALIGGNPNLKPEVSDTRSIGLVFTPTFFDGFNATIDYYNIKIDGFIKAQQVQFVLDQCYNPATNPNQDPNNPFCRFVHRNAQGEIFGQPVPPGGDVLTLSGNVARYAVNGWDLSANYQTQFSDWGMEPAWGGIALNFVGTYQPVSKSQANSATTPINCAGLFGSICPNGAPTPKWRHNLRLSWISPDNDITLSLLWRHTSAESFDNMKFSGKDSSTPCGYVFCDLAGDDDHIPSFDWFDVSGTWDIGHGIELRGGVTNLFNKRPPLIDINASNALVDSGNTFPATYDPVGRFFFGGVTLKL